MPALFVINSHGLKLIDEFTSNMELIKECINDNADVASAISIREKAFSDFHAGIVSDKYVDAMWNNSIDAIINVLKDQGWEIYYS